ncbi:MAG TPA: VOC family protein [Nocardioides sp.]|uniref:VOC family protein n=1 Tax=Nocardioides sp. TaxID=35761 RepID=UPI002E37E9F4|nr:VOC family protein [Nocardioides sp.]HEX3931724.1 VOC family protein [Nocardioides sp.]
MRPEFQVTFDAADPLAQARFWAAALGYAVPGPPGVTLADGQDPIEAWLGFLERAGVPADQRDRAAAIEDPDGLRPRVFFQKVPERKTAKNRLHLDVRAAPGLDDEQRMPTLETECERLVALGATRLRRSEPDPPMSKGFIVMADPEGNEFCLD